MVADLGIDFLAAGIGNIHGKYPANWEGLSFETLDAIQQRTGIMPLVLHGGTGIPDDMIKKAISLGVANGYSKRKNGVIRICRKSLRKIFLTFTCVLGKVELY